MKISHFKKKNMKQILTKSKIEYLYISQYFDTKNLLSNINQNLEMTQYNFIVKLTEGLDELKNILALL
jgi:hypothetical protein